MKGKLDSKKIKLLCGLLIAAFVLCFIPGGIGEMKAEAATSSYCVKYLADKGEYRFVSGNTWNDSLYNRELYYMLQDIKDGDTIVVDGNETNGACTDPILNLDLSNITLGNLTVVDGYVSVTVKECTEFMAVKSSVVTIMGNVINAHLYGWTKVNFYNNVTSLELGSVSKPSVASYTGDAIGVGTATKVFTTTDGVEQKAYYDFKANTLKITKGAVTTDAANYSTTPSATTTQTTPSTTPATDNSEYDDVPKTGESPVAVILFALTAICGAAGMTEIIRRKKLAK